MIKCKRIHENDCKSRWELVKKYEFSWEKAKKKVRGSAIPPNLWNFFYLVTIGSYSYIVVPLCHFLHISIHL